MDVKALTTENRLYASQESILNDIYGFDTDWHRVSLSAEFADCEDTIAVERENFCFFKKRVPM